MSGRRPSVPVAWARLEERGRRAMSRAAFAFAYVAGAAGLEETMAANREGFGRWRIVPRVLAAGAGEGSRGGTFRHSRRAFRHSRRLPAARV